jgi:steroid delta-isomerase-like uncharacterized protein
MTTLQQSNKSLLIRYHEAWSSGDMNQLATMLSENYIDHDLITGRHRGLDEAKASYMMWRAAFPDTVITLEHLVAEDDKVAVFGVLRATHTGNFMGVPASNKPITVSGMGIYRVEASRIIETWRLQGATSTPKDRCQKSFTGFAAAPNTELIDNKTGRGRKGRYQSYPVYGKKERSYS